LPSPTIITFLLKLLWLNSINNHFNNSTRITNNSPIEIKKNKTKRSLESITVLESSKKIIEQFLMSCNISLLKFV